MYDSPLQQLIRIKKHHSKVMPLMVCVKCGRHTFNYETKFSGTPKCVKKKCRGRLVFLNKDEEFKQTIRDVMAGWDLGRQLNLDKIL